MTHAPRAVADPGAPTDPDVADRSDRAPQSALWWALGALVAAVVLAVTFPSWQYKVPYGISTFASYALTWGPLLIALIVTARYWVRFARFRLVDVYLGLMIGVVARAVGVIVELLMTGRMPGTALMLGDVTPIYVFSAVIAPVIIAPLIEEPFFRGLLQNSLERWLPWWGSLLLTSAAFAVVHTIASGWSVSLIVTLFVYALLAGYTMQQTRRLGGAILGHAVFNGIAALISWPW